MKSYFLKITLIFSLLTVFVSAKEMFWEVNGTKGGKVYILGTLDFGHRDSYPLSQEINEAFNRSNYLIVQLGKGEKNNVFKNDEMYIKGRYDDNDSIRKHLSASTYSKLRLWLKEQKLSSNAMDRFYPWVASLTLNSLEMALWGHEKLLSLESYFYKKAQRDGKGIYSIELISEAYFRLREGDDHFQEELLKTYMDKKIASEAEASIRFKHYNDANVSYFNTVLLEPYEKHPFIKENVLDEQNRVYTNKIKRYRNNKRGRHYFLMINLENLLGDAGVIAQLKEAGIEVQSY